MTIGPLVIFISSSDPNLLQKKLVKQKIKNDGLTASGNLVLNMSGAQKMQICNFLGIIFRTRFQYMLISVNEGQVHSPLHAVHHKKSSIDANRFEPRCEKTGLRGFHPGPTQTGLYSHRRWLDA